MLHKTTNKILLLLSICLCFTVCSSLRNHQSYQSQLKHQYWFSKDHPNIAGDDDKWNYCDYKCLALQNINNNKDFVVVQLSAVLKQKFSACYVKVGTSYTLWSKVTSNAFYQQHCGQDYKDWMNEGDFDVDGIYGIGIGTMLTAADQQKMYKK